jgi:hypothetical protein
MPLPIAAPAMEFFGDEEEYNTNPTLPLKSPQQRLVPWCELESGLGSRYPFTTVCWNARIWPQLWWHHVFQLVIIPRNTSIVQHRSWLGDIHWIRWGSSSQGVQRVLDSTKCKCIPRGGCGGWGAAVGRGASPPFGVTWSAGRATAGGHGANSSSTNAAKS